MSKILVVEDLPESAELAQQILERYGHEAVIASTGRLALEAAAEQKPDLIICDYWLPDLAASSFLTKLRSDPALQKVPVLVCTATSEVALKPRCGKDGFDGFIRKPYRASTFMEAVETHLPAQPEKSLT